ncbi:Glycosyltransferase [hydrothermal vent metagenome]|uniref:Glycosyltransferase n=1 Tax=hydrothermal vent metagenome TaxID=652676 RepID=A0A1W1EL64_9ZZZZ
MKITHINFTNNLEIRTITLIKELSNRGYYQQIITSEKSLLINHLKNINNLQIIITNRFNIFKLSNLKSSDIIHYHQIELLGLSYLVNLIYKIPYVITTSSRIKNSLLYKKANHTIVTSNRIKNSINISTIYNSSSNHLINESSAKKIKDRYKYKFVIGHIGSFEDKRGQFYLIEAMKKLQLIYPTIHLIIMGEGKNELKYKTQASTLDNITFENSYNIDFIPTFNIFILPSISEHNCSLLFDVINNNIPIIATEMGTILEIIEDKKSGLLIEAKNSTQIYNAIEKLYLDKNLRKILSKNAFNKIKNYSTQEMVNRYERLYNKK